MIDVVLACRRTVRNVQLMEVALDELRTLWMIPCDGNVSRGWFRQCEIMCLSKAEDDLPHTWKQLIKSLDQSRADFLSTRCFEQSPFPRREHVIVPVSLQHCAAPKVVAAIGRSWCTH